MLRRLVLIVKGTSAMNPKVVVKGSSVSDCRPHPCCLVNIPGIPSLWAVGWKVGSCLILRAVTDANCGQVFSFSEMRPFH
jgi:hypothetical protein